MAEWKTDRKLRVRQGGQAEDEAVPLLKSAPTTHPRLTLPSLPKVSAVPSQRLLPPRPRSSGLTGQHPTPSVPARSSGLTGHYPIPPAPARSSGLTGQYPTPLTAALSGLTGQHLRPQPQRVHQG